MHVLVHIARRSCSRLKSFAAETRQTAAPHGAAVFLRGRPLGYKGGMNEFEIIARYFAPLAGDGAFGLQDDAALITARAGFDLVVTTDAISEGTDFFAFDPADTIAQKALRVN